MGGKHYCLHHPSKYIVAEALATWVANTTDKPLLAAFSTHFHPDHYLSGAALLSQFPETKYYANSRAVALIKNEVQEKVCRSAAATFSILFTDPGMVFWISFWAGALVDGLVVDEAAIPMPYDFTFFTLPGDEDEPIELLSLLVAETIDETMFWIPSNGILIAGDSVYSHTVHLWLADLLSPALTSAWLSTLDFIEHLKPRVIVPGHTVSLDSFGPAIDLQHSRKYLTYFQEEIESKGPDAYTPEEIFNNFNSTFPGLLSGQSQTSQTLLDITAQQFGRSGTRQVYYVDLASYNNTAQLDGWNLGL